MSSPSACGVSETPKMLVVGRLPVKTRAGTISSGVPSARTSSAVLPKARALVWARKLPRKSSWTSAPSHWMGLALFTKPMKSAGIMRVPWWMSW